MQLLWYLGGKFVALMFNSREIEMSEFHLSSYLKKLKKSK